MKTLAIIPARYASTRFPGKPLVDINGKSMIRRVFEEVSHANLVNQVIVATDDQRIYDHVIAFGGTAMMTSSEHPSGTDRCGAVALQFSDFQTIINVQGDEPFIPPKMIDQLIDSFQKAKDAQIGTLVKKIDDQDDLFSPHVVKSVFDKDGKALYFSRQAIPFQQGVEVGAWLKNHDYYCHIGMYIFDRKTLLELIKLPSGILEQKEKLEQLRWLENGYSISIGITEYESKGIDTPEDLEGI